MGCDKLTRSRKTAKTRHPDCQVVKRRNRHIIVWHRAM
nr:hypothetical protein [Salinibius halmophilus]